MSPSILWPASSSFAYGRVAVRESSGVSCPAELLRLGKFSAEPMPLSAQFKDGWDTWVLLTVCPTVSFVPQEPLAASEAPNLKYLEG